MSDSNDVSSFSTQKSCDCYKRLQTYGIPLYITDENDLYGESQKKITFENAFELPGILRINENVTEYLYVEDNELSNLFPHMAEVLPVLGDFEENLLSFWILDIFIEGLWTAQNAKMNFEHQKATLLWIAYFFNYIQSKYLSQNLFQYCVQVVYIEGLKYLHKELEFKGFHIFAEENPTRRSLFDHLKSLLFNFVCNDVTTDVAEESEGSSQRISIAEEEEEEEDYISRKQIWKLPLPPDIDGEKKYEYEMKLPTNEEEEEEEEEDNITTIQSSEGEKDTTSFTSQINDTINDTRTNLADMKVILEILYRIFGRIWVYIEIQTVFHAMPATKYVDLPFTLKSPKPLLKPDTPSLLRLDKLGKQSSLSEKSFEEIDPEIQLHKNDFILPLQVADESKLILKQFFPQSSSQRSMMGRRKT